MKIAILSSNQSHMETLRKLLAESSATRQISLYKEGSGELTAIVDQEHPDLVILDGVQCDISKHSELEQFLRAHPNLAVIALCENESPEFLISAMRAGVRDVLPLPVDHKALLDAVSRVEQRLVSGTASKRSQGKVIAFVACKGGSGATFIATNLGYILAEKENVKVAFLDLNLQFGDAALFVSDQVPANSIVDVTENLGRLDASFLASAMVQVLPNYALLAAPENTERAVGVRPEHIDVLLKLAKANYDFVILDVSRMLNAISVKALDQADLILPVLQETLPFIRDGKRLIHTLQTLGYAKEKIQPVLNRHEKRGDIRLDDVEAALGMKMFKTIPNSYDAVTTSVNQGIPIYNVDKHDPVAKALVEMSHDLATGSQGKKDGWLSRVFHA